jgi:hypothetical protein
MALLFFKLGASWGWVVNSTPPAALSPGKRPGTHCTGGWVGPRADLNGCGKSRPHKDSIAGLSKRSESPHQRVWWWNQGSWDGRGMWNCRVRREMHRLQVLVGKSAGRPRCKWEDNIKTDLKGISRGSVDWIHLPQKSAKWQGFFLNTAIKFWVP